MNTHENATPRPWSKGTVTKRALYGGATGGVCIGEIFTEEDADLIVSAVNQHDALVSAVRELREALSLLIRTGNDTLRHPIQDSQLDALNIAINDTRAVLNRTANLEG